MPLLSGARAIADLLPICDVKLVVGLTGHTVMEIIDEVCNSGRVRTIPVKNEMNGAFMVYGYNRFTGRTASIGLWHVAGAAHTAPAVLSSLLDKVPMVHICGDVLTEFKGREAFQEVPVYELFSPISKWVFRIERTEQIPEAFIKAIAISESGTPGPCVLDIPFDHAVNRAEVALPERITKASKPEADEDSTKCCCEVLLRAERPVILAGSGIIYSNACKELQELAELLCIPIVTGHSAKGCVSDEHPLVLGIPGFNGWRCANEYLEKSDCWLAIGFSFTQLDMQEWKVKHPKELIHIDINPLQIGKIYAPTIGIVSDAKIALQKMLKYLRQKIMERKPYHEQQRFKEISQLKANWLEELLAKLEVDGKPINPFRLVKELRDVTSEVGGIIVADSSLSYEFSSQAMMVRDPKSLFYSHNFGCLGAGFPTAIGVKLASPNRPVICLTGDGGFYYSFSELAVCMAEKIPIVVVIMNNGWLGTNKYICDTLFGGRRYWTKLNNPDWVRLAKSFGAEGRRVDDPKELRIAIKEGLKCEIPFVIDAVIDDDVMPLLTGRPWKIRW